MESVQTFGKKKSAVAIAHCKRGKGLIKLNGVRLDLVKPDVLLFKVFEPIKLLGTKIFSSLDVRIRTKGGGHVSQVYAVRQALSKAIVAFHQKFVDEETKLMIKQKLLNFDRTLLVQTIVDVNQRSLVVAVLVQDSKSLTVKIFALFIEK